MKSAQTLLSLAVFFGCTTSEKTEAPSTAPTLSALRPAAAAEFRTNEGAGSNGAGPTSPRRRTMTTYLTRFSYTPETWARLAKHPEDRRNAARSYI